MNRSASAALVLLFGFAGAGSAAAEPNAAFRAYKMPAQAGAPMQLMIGQGQVQGAAMADDFHVQQDPKSGCTQYVGGVVLEKGSKVDGNIESTTYVDGIVANVCR